MHWQTVSHGSKETESVAAQLGANLRGGETIELSSDLGGGKTTFTRGLLNGLGSTDHVSSPTFTISKEYKAGDLRILHFDFYRMGEPGHVADMLAEAALDEQTICIIEWGGIVQGMLPVDRITVAFAKDADDEHRRMLTINYPDERDYIMKGLK